MNDRMFDTALVRPAREGAERFLRLALKLDAVATGAVGALALVAAPMLDDLFGTPITLLRSVGLVLVAYAAAIWFSGTRRTLDRAAAWAAVTLTAV